MTKAEYMKLALRLARRGEGKTSPNPMVGSVIVKNGVIVGQGYHKKAGEAHAEINALLNAGENAKNGDMYVNLEPCCHFNRTPPCTNAIISSGIKSVIIGILDPNPKVSGKGVFQLKNAGIKVTVGILEAECRKINEYFVRYITSNRPFVILKAAQSLDGKIATNSGNSKWITNLKSRTFVHKLRSHIDAVLVGVDTVIKDDPLLTARMIKNPVKQPIRIILDSSLRMPMKAKLLCSQRLSDIIVVTTNDVSSSRIKNFKNMGVKILEVDKKNGMVDIKSLLLKLGEMNITSLLVEGGSKVNSSFVENGLIDKILFFLSGCIIGGKNAPSTVGGAGFNNIESCLKISRMKLKRFDNDIMIEGYVNDVCLPGLSKM